MLYHDICTPTVMLARAHCGLYSILHALSRHGSCLHALTLLITRIRAVLPASTLLFLSSRRPSGVVSSFVSTSIVVVVVFAAESRTCTCTLNSALEC
ncbi:hypothetical protein OH76DRAFT_78757 [Lentinus brumalis]|uniref:Uncharacterized protein n=1 Tax=Lentinus brumalis TaxID=2498619 RepID=A0A371DKX7_9APHY|nr:hypothetical protein OH76DRAFT_78757 [Polyporus brumalis]